MRRAIAIVALLGCGKEERKEAKPAATPADAAPRSGDRFAAWDMAARRAAFAGAHVTPGGVVGTWEAWNVEGDRVTIWNGTEERVEELAVISPCWVETTFKAPDGSLETTTTTYTLRDGRLVMGLGGAGARKGREAIACTGGRMVRLAADGTCTELDQDPFEPARFEEKPGSCRFVTEGRESFVAVIDGTEHRLLVDRDALLSEQLAGTHSEKVADYAAAKAALAARNPPD